MQALQYVELDIDYCSLTYAQPPCQAQLSFIICSDSNTVLFDWTNDYLTRGATLTGVADSKLVTLSVWVRRESNTFDQRILSASTTLAGNVERIGAGINATGNFYFVAGNAAGTVIANITSNNV